MAHAIPSSLPKKLGERLSRRRLVFPSKAGKKLIKMLLIRKPNKNDWETTQWAFHDVRY
jgi:hypothetical protein